MRTTFKAAAFLAVAVLAGAARGAPNEPPVVYEGELDGKIAVTMELSIDGLGHEVRGTYMYAIRGKDLYLKGKATGNSLTLTEETNAAEITGTFKLTRNDDQTLTGTWTSADGRREMSVGLAKIGTKAAIYEYNQESYRLSMGYMVFSPRNAFLQGLNARLELEARAASDAALKDARADAKEQAKAPKGLVHYEYASSRSPEVTFADAGVASIRTMHMVDSGGAHPNYNYTAANYLWKNDQVVTLGLEDMVKPGSLKALAALCVKDLRGQKASWPEQVVMDKEHPPTVNATKAGLLVTFDPYVAGSYAEGTYTVLIPWKEAADFIPAGSPVQRLMGPATTPAEASPRVAPAPASSRGGDFPRPG